MNFTLPFSLNLFWSNPLFFIVFIGIAWLSHTLIYRMTQRMAKRWKMENTDTFLEQTHRSTQLIFLVVGAMLSFYFSEFSEKIRLIGWHILQILVIFSIAWVLITLLQTVRIVTLQRFDIKAEDNLKARKQHTRFQIVERILIALVVLVAFASILMTFDSVRRIGTSLLASAGLAGVILGFAAQKSIATLLAGIQIAFTQPIRLEDAVVIENEWGWIEEINLTYVVVRIWDLRRLIVPINYFIEKPFQNWTRTSAEILGTVMLYTDYRVPFDELREELKRIVEQTPLWNKKTQVLQVTDAKKDTIEIRVLVSAKNSPEAWDLRVLVREKMIAFLQKNYPESLPHTRILLPENQALNPEINTKS